MIGRGTHLSSLSRAVEARLGVDGEAVGSVCMTTTGGTTCSSQIGHHGDAR